MRRKTPIFFLKAGKDADGGDALKYTLTSAGACRGEAGKKGK
jgi:hypothetical protein